MNRFEHYRSPGADTFKKVAPPAVFVILILFLISGVSSLNRITDSGRLESLTKAVNRSIAQCYAVEGFYPRDLEYLSDHYGLTYDPDDFIIDYDYYGDNLYPYVSVMRKTGGSADD